MPKYRVGQTVSFKKQYRSKDSDYFKETKIDEGYFERMQLIVNKKIDNISSPPEGEDGDYEDFCNPATGELESKYHFVFEIIPSLLDDTFLHLKQENRTNIVVFLYESEVEPTNLQLNLFGEEEHD